MTISAKIIADSISPDGVRITTFELEYQRFIHAEFMTHRMFSRNAASSRAIPVKRSIELVLEDTARPTHWGKNQPGMSAREECNKAFPRLVIGFDQHGNMVDRTIEATREEVWDEARDAAVRIARDFDDAGYHKQIVNRILEPYTHIKVVCTATDYDNFYWLRRHPDAQPEIQELAEQMWQAAEASTPRPLNPGAWHTPYYQDGYWEEAAAWANPVDGKPIDDHLNTLEDALAVSASCCAQVSYRRLDDSIEKAHEIYDRLVDTTPVHASPFEHQATPMETEGCCGWSEGITHADRNGVKWSGNLRGWIQHRQLIPGNAHTYLSNGE